jgi:cell division protein FtsA
MKKGNLIVGLDVGTTKICAVVGDIEPVSSGENLFANGTDDGVSGSAREQVEIIGIGTSPSRGLRKGVVVNIESTVESIKKAVEEAETMAGININAVHVGIAGGHIHSFPSHGVIAVKEKEIGQQEIERVIDAAKAIAIPLDREVLHVVPVGFTVDGQAGINDPRGMSGVRLEADVRIITGAITSVQNLIKSCQKAGLDVIDIVLEPLASAEATLSREEKDLGVGIIDIGGGTTDIALFQRGSICYTSVLTIGGNNFTNDVAIGLRVPSSEAERLKKNYGCSQLSMVDKDEQMEVVYPGGKRGRKIPRQHLIEILQPRAEELIYLVKEEIMKSGFYGNMTSGMVLTGGAVLMKGMDTMAENVLELPTRLGKPEGIGGITNIVCSPIYATGVGLVHYGGRDIVSDQKFNNGNIFNGITMKMREWVKGIFN